MRRCAGSGWAAALFVVAIWRSSSELLGRRRRLVATDLLDVRIAIRRDRRIERALARAGYSELARIRRHAARVPVMARAGVATDSAVHVGAVHGDDHDDVGLLEAAMRRAVRERMAVDAAGIDRRAVGRVDWVQVLADDLAASGADATGDTAPWWSIVAAGTGVALTIVPLVRPLGSASPWLAIGGIALVAAGWAASRRR